MYVYTGRECLTLENATALALTLIAMYGQPVATNDAANLSKIAMSNLKSKFGV